MSAVDETGIDAERLLESFPTFELVYRFDDPDDPREVTLFPADGDGDLTTTWISVGVEAAVPLEDAV